MLRFHGFTIHIVHTPSVLECHVLTGAIWDGHYTSYTCKYACFGPTFLIPLIFPIFKFIWSMSFLFQTNTYFKYSLYKYRTCKSCMCVIISISNIDWKNYLAIAYVLYHHKYHYTGKFYYIFVKISMLYNTIVWYICTVGWPVTCVYRSWM